MMVSLPPPPLRTLAPLLPMMVSLPGAAGGVLDVDQHVGADVDTFRYADRQVSARKQAAAADGIQEGADRGAAERRWRGAVDGVEIDRDASWSPTDS